LLSLELSDLVSLELSDLVSALGALEVDGAGVDTAEDVAALAAALVAL